MTVTTTAPTAPADHHRSSEHRTNRAGWLRAAVLGANDGLLSVSSILVGVAASNASATSVLVGGLAGLAAGAMSMAVGEYVSVSSQTDVERADLAVEKRHQESDPEGELEELTEIYRDRGLSDELAAQVARALHEKDPLAAHLRDELGQDPATKARPVQAALASLGTFSVGGAVPFLGLLAPSQYRITAIVVVTLIGLAAAGFSAAKAAGIRALEPTVRVLVGGAAAMAVTAFVGHFAGHVTL